MRLRLLLMSVLAGVIGTWLSAAAPVGASRRGTAPRLEVVASGLSNPRKLFVASDGAVYVAEAGTGGSDFCSGTGQNATCVGRSGSITRVIPGKPKHVVTGLASWATPSEQQAAGPAGVVVRGATYYVLLQDDFVKPTGGNRLGRDGARAGDLIATAAGSRTAPVIADLGAFEAAHNPDHGAGPGPKLGNPSIDSDPYALTAFRGGFAVADAGANDLLWIGPTRAVSLLAVFPTQLERLSKGLARQLGAPASMHSIPVQSVPSCVVRGPDGALYVGELTGRPFAPGTARIWRVVPGRRPSLYASGFTNISDIAFDGKNLLVLEIADKGLFDRRSTGALIRLQPNGSRRVVLSRGLKYPTGLAVGGGFIYISNDGLFPGSGPGPHGEVVRVPASLGA